jgi:fatty acid desaturase
LDAAVSEAIRTSGKAILFVSSAVAVGYATLALTGFSMHQSLGLLVALAMVVSAGSTLLVVPMLVRWWQPAFLGAAVTRERPEPEFEPLPGESVAKPRLPRDFYEIDLFASFAFIAVAAGLFVGGGWAAATVATSTMSLWVRVPLTAVLVVVAAHGGHLLGFVGHEGIHLNLVRNKYGSVLLGSLLSSMVSFMAIGYGVSHWSHHRFTNREQDPDARLYSVFPTFWRRFFFARLAGSRSHTRNTIAAALGRPLGTGHRLPFGPRTQRALAIANLAFFAGWVTVYVAIAIRSPIAAFVGIALPILVVVPMSGLRGYLEHGGTDRGAIRDSRSYAAPLYTLLFFGNNLHLEHHMYPGVPCYRLPRLHRWLRAQGTFARYSAHVDYSVAGPWRHATGLSQYPLFVEEGRTHIVFEPQPTSSPSSDGGRHSGATHA